MPLKNIECQLAQGQLNRYMGGDGLSDSALEQLEGHIRECEDCTLYLDEKKRALQAMVEGPKEPPSNPKPILSTHAVVEIEDEPRPANAFLATLAKKRAALDSAVQPIEPSVTSKTANRIGGPYAKPLMLSFGLAAVMIAMSYLMRDPTRMLGDKVDAQKTGAASSESKEVAQPESNGAVATLTDNSKPTKTDSVQPADNIGGNAETPSDSPNPQSGSTPVTTSNTAPAQPKTNAQPPARTETPSTPKASTTKRRASSLTKRRPVQTRRAPLNRPAIAKPKAASSGIRVYENNGDLIAE